MQGNDEQVLDISVPNNNDNYEQVLDISVPNNNDNDEQVLDINVPMYVWCILYLCCVSYAWLY